MQNQKKYKHFIGIDVAKDKVDAFISDTGEFIQVKNEKKSLESWIKTLVPQKDLLVIIDLTGGYEDVCVQLFCSAHFNIHRAEGRRVKSFMKATGQLAKTDKIDAYCLAQYGESLQDNLVMYQGTQNKIKPLVLRLDTLKELLRQELNHSIAPKIDKMLLKVIQKHIAYIKKEIAFLENEVEKIIHADVNLLKQYN